MNRRRIISACCAAFCFLATCPSSPLHAAERMTWEECVRRAARDNQDIKAAQSQLQSSTALRKAAYSGYLPQLSANFNLTRGNSYSFQQLGGVPLNTPAGDNTTSSVAATLDQNLFAGFQTTALVDQGKANQDYASATLDVKKSQASYDLKTAFANLLYAQKYLSLTEKILKRREENAQLVELRFESGTENKGSVMLSRAFVNQARYDRVVARNATAVSRAQLAKAMGISDTEEIEISGSIPLNEPGTAEPDFKKMVSTTPQLHQSIAQERASQAGQDIAASAFYPNVDLTGLVAAQGNNGPPSSSKRSIALNVSLPLFTGGNDYYSYKSATAQFAAASHLRESTEQQLLPELRRSYASYSESVEKLKVDTAFLEAAQVRAEIGRSKYNNGLLSFEDWDIIENDLISKEKISLLSERDRILAEANWELVQGKGALP